jgi:hypothetical protein
MAKRLPEDQRRPFLAQAKALVDDTASDRAGDSARRESWLGKDARMMSGAARLVLFATAIVTSRPTASDLRFQPIHPLTQCLHELQQPVRHNAV